MIQSSAFGQTLGGGGSSGTGDPTTTSPGISGQSIQTSELMSKSDEMPRFSGFRSLNQTTFLGNSGTYYPPRASTGEKLSSGTQRSSSGNTRTTTTGARTSRTAASTTRNRNTSSLMNSLGRIGGFGGTNTNTVRSVTSLGYSLQETRETARPTDMVRSTQLENRINNNGKVKPVSPVTVEIDGITAILRGTVKNEHERKLLEQFVKLEPGIAKVKNELILPDPQTTEGR
ncbi:MAG: BON domain-containing protein [Planctomycetaceae bacterium]|nr:BON domain-containing protein [Planctomycetaceae bacterium]